MVAGLVLLIAGSGGQLLVNATPATHEAAELDLYPSGLYLDLVAFGQPTLLADIAWLQAIQYYGKHRLTDRRYPLAGHLFDVITDLDPSFVTAYIFGALVLEEETGDLGAPRNLFQKGIRANPGDWRVSFHSGFLEYLRGDTGVGAGEMAVASRLPGAPPFAARLAAHAHSRAGSLEQAIRLWKQIARESTDPAIRALAEDRVWELRGRRAGRRKGPLS